MESSRKNGKTNLKGINKSCFNYFNIFQLNNMNKPKMLLYVAQILSHNWAWHFPLMQRVTPGALDNRFVNREVKLPDFDNFDVTWYNSVSFCRDNYLACYQTHFRKQILGRTITPSNPHWAKDPEKRMDFTSLRSWSDKLVQKARNFLFIYFLFLRKE